MLSRPATAGARPSGRRNVLRALVVPSSFSLPRPLRRERRALGATQASIQQKSFAQSGQHPQFGAIEFEQGMRVERGHDAGQMALDEFLEFAGANVAGPDKQEPSSLLKNSRSLNLPRAFIGIFG